MLRGKNSPSNFPWIMALENHELLELIPIDRVQWWWLSMDYPSELYMNVLYTEYESSMYGMQGTQACVRKPHAPLARTTIWRLKREAMVGNERHVGPRL